MDQFCYETYEDNQQSNNNIYEQIESLNMQLFFVTLVIIALFITLYVIQGYKDIILNGKNARHTQKELYHYSLVSSFLTTAASLYFLYYAYKNYKNDNSTANSLYLIVAILVGIGAVLRFLTLYSSPFEDESANEII